MTEWNSLNFQEGASPFMEEFIFFHDFIMVIIVFIISAVFYMMISSFTNKWVNKTLLDNQIAECVWTIIPALVLIQIAIPSLIILYSMDGCEDWSLTLRVTGHQWYWTYELDDQTPSSLDSVEVESYLIPVEESDQGMPRLLETDGRPTLPAMTQVRALVTSADVLHSWAIPSLGVKVDAIPGRLNQMNIFSWATGVNYGQCSEICGANHSFMPIVLEFVWVDDYLMWLYSR